MSDLGKKAKEIFWEALDQSGDPEVFINEACKADAELRQRVQTLLDAHQQAGGFLAPSQIDQTIDSDAPPKEMTRSLHAAAPKPADQIGPYKLLEEIGEGGMGSVWIAKQSEPIKRRVAIKLIKAGMDSQQVLARFEAERQALAMMDHPNIARVLDGGMTDQGRPYFAMEYVKGVPLTEYCDQAKLSVNERLELFLPICSAVQHAHQKGVIHRDLKPSNILVCLYDGKPVPKVIDFGLAKAMHHSLTEQSLYTAHGVMVGTPLYMSPEQAEHNNLDIDTRTDVYALGVILYELLTGTTPLERAQMKEAAYNEVLRLIKEVEPPKPSTRLSGSESLPTVAAQRNIEPAQLTRSVTGDLDWVVMKALEKERSRRYETANGLAEDIRRHLSDEPVSACPPSTRYRMQKFIQRNRAGVIAASAIAVALMLGVVGTTTGMLWAMSEKQAAVAAREAETEAKQEAITNAELARASAKRADRARLESDVAKYGSQIRLADATYSKVNGVEAQKILASTDPKLRGWEYDRLKTVWNSRQRTFATDRPYQSVAITPDGELVAGAGDGGDIRLFEFQTGLPAGELATGGAIVYSLEFSLDGKLLAAATDATAHVWEVSSRREIGKISFTPPQPLPEPAPENERREFFFKTQRPIITLDPTGKKIAVAAYGEVQIWDGALNKKLLGVPNTEIPDKYVYVCDLDFHPGGTRLLILQRVGHYSDTQPNDNPDLEVHLLDVQSGELIRSDEHRTEGFFSGLDGSVEFDSSGEWFVTIPWRRPQPDGQEGITSVYICDAQTGQLRRYISTDHATNNLIALSKGGSQVVIGHSLEGTASVFDAGTGRILHRLVSEFGDLQDRKEGQVQPRVSAIAVSADGTRVVSAFGRKDPGSTSNLRYARGLVGWDVNEFVAIKTMQEAESLDPQPDVEGLIPSIRKGRPIFPHDVDWFAQQVTVSKRAVAPGKTWKPSENDPITRFVDFRSANTGKRLFTLGNHPLPAEAPYRWRGAIDVSEGGQLLAHTTPSGVEVWNLSERKSIRKFDDASAPVEEVRFDPRGQYLAAVAYLPPQAADATNPETNPAKGLLEFLIWDLSSGELVSHEKRAVTGGYVQPPWRILAFHPSEKVLYRCRDKYVVGSGSTDDVPAKEQLVGCHLETLKLETGATIDEVELPHSIIDACIAPGRNQVYYSVTSIHHVAANVPNHLDRSFDGIWLWDLESNERAHVYKGTVLHLNAAPNGKRLMFREHYSLGREHTPMMMIDTRTYQEVYKSGLEQASPDTHYVFAPDGEVMRCKGNVIQKLLAKPSDEE